MKNKLIFYIFTFLLLSLKIKADEKYWWYSGAEWKIPPILEKAYWIWNDKDMLSDPEKGNPFVFRKNIFIKKQVKNAYIIISAQGKYTFLINEEIVGTDDDVITLEKYDIKKFLKKGENEFRVKAQTDTWFAGLFLCGEIEFIDGEKLEIISDKTWEIEKKDGTFKNAEEIVKGVNGGFWNNVGRIMVMPEEWYRLNINLKVPGIKWMKPYYGEKLKLLVIIPRACNKYKSYKAGWENDKILYKKHRNNEWKGLFFNTFCN